MGSSIQASIEKFAMQSSSNSSSPTTCAVVVTYNPHPSFVDNVAAISSQVDKVVIVDNGSLDETQKQLYDLEKQYACKVILNSQNLGIAAALNIGVRHALSEGFDWVVTLDQDSRVSDQFIVEMRETYQQAQYPERIAIIAPSYVDRESEVRGDLMRSKDGEILTSMTSGSMMPSSALQNIGEFDESLYMDYVDIEFCLRSRRDGMLILQSPAILFHSLGRTTYHHLLGRQFSATNHSAARRYYITRNRLLLMWRYANDRSWLSREIRAALFETVKILLVEADKWGKVCAIAVGITDALSGRHGRRVAL